MSNIYVRRSSVGNLLLGRKLATEEAPHQTISKTIGLAVFASDALSSVAYATQEILIILALAGIQIHLPSLCRILVSKS